MRGVIGISIKQVSKRFGETVALDRVDLEIAPGEIFFLLGPSGCGKTTLLRALAGFHFPDSGEIYFGNEEVTRMPAHLRRTGMVFQNYALWPHKTVAENVAFGLEEAGEPKGEIKRRVAEALASVHMEGYGERPIHALSGGQQQRVALARALVIRPRCLLLDEPLSNLDAKLRLEMRTEIRRVCKGAGLTAIYVTHDQKEALSVADRMAVFHAGRVCQIGTPEEVYRRPNSPFVADFVGETNFLEGRVVARAEGEATVQVAGGHRLVSQNLPDGEVAEGEEVVLSVRPEAWGMGGTAGKKGTSENAIPGVLAESIYLGEIAQYRVETESGVMKALEMNPRVANSGGRCVLTVDAEDVVVLKKGI